MATPVLFLIVGLLAGLALGTLLTLWLRPAGSDSSSPKIAALEERLSSRETEIARQQQESAVRQLEASASQLEIGKLRGQLQMTEQHAQKEIAAYKDAENTLKDSFTALARQALRENNESFVQLAKPILTEQQSAATAELDKKQTAVDELLKPIRETLKKLETETSQLEVKREGAYKEVLTEIKNIQQTHESIRRETSQLVQALRSPKARGDWGQMILKRCIEFAGMGEHHSFELEKYLRSDADQAFRPDCVINLPNQRTIIIDAKTPLSAYMEATAAAEAGDETLRQEKLKLHAAQVRTHLNDLEKISYWKQFQLKGSNTPDFVVCFLPSEGLFSAALEQDPSLIEYGSAQVILATPTTLIALLKAVAYGWQQVNLTRDAQTIRQTAVAMYEKIRGAGDNFTAIGNRIKSAADAWEKMRGQLEGRGGVFSHARKLNQLKVGETEISEAKEIALDMTELQAEDWQSEQLQLPDSTKQ
jgi:DNA recombination protein RmuC